MTLLDVCRALLRDPARLIESAEDPQRFAEIASRLTAAILLSAGILGAVVGTYRGGSQVIFAALKMPLLVLVPLIVVLPAMGPLYRLADVPVSSRRLAAAGLASAARTSILAAAAGPVLWLLYSVELDYHLSIVLLAALLILTGLPGLAVLRLASPSRPLGPIVASAALMGLVLSQTGWLLRPFVVRPTAEITVLRPVEGDILSALGTSAMSSVGIYPDEFKLEPRGALGKSRDR